MTIIGKCRDCGKPVSDSWEVCPNCFPKDVVKKIAKYQQEAELEDVLKAAATKIAFGGDGSEKRMRQFFQLLEHEINLAAGDMSGDHATTALVNIRKMIKTRLEKGAWRPLW